MKNQHLSKGPPPERIATVAKGNPIQTHQNDQHTIERYKPLALERFIGSIDRRKYLQLFLS